jgi:AAA family ATP:ADP antiporter
MQPRQTSFESHADLTPFERFLTLFTRVRAGEGRVVAVLFSHSFMVLGSYYLLRPLREALILSEGSAELRSYAAAFQAAVLLVLVPLYGWLVHRGGKSLIIQRVNIFFIVNLLLFSLAGFAGLRFGFVFFVWVGVYNLMVIAQFWAFAADLLNVKAGQRLFAVIGVGGSLGAAVGARVCGLLLDPIGPYGVMAAAAAVLSVTLLLSRLASRIVPPDSRAVPVAGETPAPPSWLGGLRVVFRSQYLIAIAALVLLLNWVMSNGDYILNRFIEQAVLDALGADAGSDAKAHWIGEFYSVFQAWINTGALLLQLFVVSRVFMRAGVHVAILILPAVMAGSFLVLDLLPAFLLAQYLLGGQRTLEYSLMNTTRNALFLPTTREQKYEGKTAIDTLCQRFGDVVSAMAVYAATGIGMGREGFIGLNIVLSLALLALAWYIGRHYRAQATSESFNRAPELRNPVPDAHWLGAGPFRHQIPRDAFVDADAGDVLHVHVSGHDAPLPDWIRYDARTLTLHCDAPPAHAVEVRLRATARDFDGLEAHCVFTVRRVPGH